MAKLARCLTGTEAELLEAQALIDAALGYPKPGRNVGLGPHKPIPETWDGKGEAPNGWTLHATAPMLTDAGFVLPVDGIEAELLSKILPDKLQTSLAAASTVDVKGACTPEAGQEYADRKAALPAGDVKGETVERQK